jgi:hypothetical protein
MANLQVHAAISEKDIDISKSALVASSFLKEHGVGPSGMVFGFGAKYHRPNGSEYTFQDVPLQAIVECVRNNLLGRRTGVSDGVEPSRRKEIFDKIMTDLPSSYKAKVVWEDEPPPLDPNSKPTTPFSAPKPVSFSIYIALPVSGMLKHHFTRTGSDLQSQTALSSTISHAPQV